MNDANPFSAIVSAIPTVDGFLQNLGDFAEDVFDVVLNIGAADGVEIGHNYIVFGLGPEIYDPLTEESLGHFEILKGKGRIVHVQERICTLRSANSRSVPRYTQNALAAMTGDRKVEMLKEPIPFEEITLGDKARRI